MAGRQTTRALPAELAASAMQRRQKPRTPSRWDATTIARTPQGTTHESSI